MARRAGSPNEIGVVRDVASLRARVAAWRRAGETVGLVPTMGALHDGHLALVHRAGALCDHVVASIFVNPTQFGPNEDFARYPRDEAADRRLLEAGGCELLFAPGVDEMYPPAFATAITVGAIAEGLCGPFRPAHFAGVATVVAKLLLQAQPDVACFGEKDYQQLQIIRRMVRDLDVPVRIEGVATVREADGLALSSRNRYLTPDERGRAVALFRVLTVIAEALAKGTRSIEDALAWGRSELVACGFAAIDYLAVCDAADLTPLAVVDRSARVLAAAWLGRTRLIDNLGIAAAPPPGETDRPGRTGFGDTDRPGSTATMGAGTRPEAGFSRPVPRGLKTPRRARAIGVSRSREHANARCDGAVSSSAAGFRRQPRRRSRRIEALARSEGDDVHQT